MLTRVTWRSWCVFLGLLLSYLILGIWLSGRDDIEAWIYRIGLTACTLMPFVFLITYTLSKNEWWSNNVGAALIRLMLAFVPVAGPLAWVFWFQGGMLTNTYLAWLAVAGPILSAIAILWVSIVFQRISKLNIELSKRNGDSNGERLTEVK